MLNSGIIDFLSSNLLILIGAYLIGSVSFGLVLTRVFVKQDIRKVGSGNIGATNVLRTGNKFLALLTLLLDGGKGSLAIFIAVGFSPINENNISLAIFTGFASVIGHNFPIWTKFRGGKGIATTLGVLLTLAWPIGLASCLTWLVVAALSRYSSLAGIISLASSPFYAWYAGSESLIILASFLSALSIIRHRENIRRLVNGTEKKIGS